MQLMINVLGSAREEIELELEHNVPPVFKKVHDAVEWAEEHLPMNVYFEVWSKNTRVWYQGFTRTGQGQFLRGIGYKLTSMRPCPSELRCGR